MFLPLKEQLHVPGSQNIVDEFVMLQVLKCCPNSDMSLLQFKACVNIMLRVFNCCPNSDTSLRII